MMMMIMMMIMMMSLFHAYPFSCTLERCL